LLLKSTGANKNPVITEITTQFCDVTSQSSFKKAVLFKDAHFDEVAEKCLESFGSYGLRATQINVRSGDRTFRYELAFSLFNGNGKFKISAEKFECEFHNVITDKDVEVVQDCLAKVYEQVPLPEVVNSLVSVTAHATLPSMESLQKYLLVFAKPERQIVSGGTIVHVLCQNWAQEVKLTVERSMVYPAGLFLAWSTTCPQKKLSRDDLKNIGLAFEESATKLDLTFARKK